MSDQLPLPISSQETPGREAGAEEKRAAYRERLHRHLQDPAFRALEGFPLGDDEAILALSDPPYYTACPNPFLAEIIEMWQAEQEAGRGAEEQGGRGAALPSIGQVERESGGGDSLPSPPSPTPDPQPPAPPLYHREPFAADVSEGKNDPIYNAHSYHTKVPHKAIMRYILHYTGPGDIVFDGFCGSGMTGMAAQLCGDRQAVASLGYFVDAAGYIYERAPSPSTETGRFAHPIARLGVRQAVLNDLSPAATFIAANYNLPVDAAAFEKEANRILAEVEWENGWMYETWHPHCHHPQRVKAKINYTVWSEIFLCPQCSNEMVFLDEALDTATKRVKDQFFCPHCQAQVSKRTLDKVRVKTYDPVLGTVVETLKRRPVLIEYETGRARYTKRVDAADLEILGRIEQLPSSHLFPVNPLPIAQMYHGSRLAPKGVTHVHQLFLPRQHHTLCALWTKAVSISDPRMRAFVLFAFEQTIWGMSLLNRYGPTHFSQVNRYLTGVYYISSLISEVSPRYILGGKIKRLAKAFGSFSPRAGQAAVTTQSAAGVALPPNSVDYIFTDPPFGENIYYADLNYLVESWHKVWTDSRPEAIIDQAKQKQLADYQELMRRAFRNYYRILKPGRWLTVEFHNSHNSVWTAIQEALLSAGFVVADTRTLNKQQSSYRQVTAASAAKQDLVISAYKPLNGFERRFLKEAGTPAGVWEFVRQHLAQLPVVVERGGQLEIIAERQDYLLFDRMVAVHIQRGASVPLSTTEFYAGLRERFIERDGMFFLPDQVLSYDSARLRAEGVAQLPLILSDEKSAIQWLRQQLDPSMAGRPQTYQELQPRFLTQLHQARHEILPELGIVLEQNFLQDENGRWYVPDPARAGDLEKIRQKTLLREFNGYLAGRGRLRQFRSEAIRAGFADAWDRRDYATIVQVAERLPDQVLQEDPDLLMYYDNASLRVDR